MGTIKFQSTGPEYTPVIDHQNQLLGAIYWIAQEKQHVFRSLSKNTSFSVSELHDISVKMADMNAAKIFSSIEQKGISLKPGGIKYGQPYFQIYHKETVVGSIYFGVDKFTMAYDTGIIWDMEAVAELVAFVDNLNAGL